MEVKKDDLSYFSPLVTFQVEDTIFKVPRREFEEDSEVFAGMYTLPPGTSEEGESDGFPLRLDGVLASDFRCFLQALFPRPAHCSTKPYTDHDLEMALKLARMWCFDRLQKALIKEFEALQLPASRKLQLARLYDIKQWYISGLRTLALRSSSLTLEEAEQLGLDLTVVVSTLRDKRHQIILDCKKFIQQKDSGWVSGRDIEGNSKWEVERGMDKVLENLSQERNWN